MRRAVGTILEAGFQMESEAFKTLVEKGREDSLRPLVDEVLKMASLAQPRPLFISADLVVKAAEHLDLSAASGNTVGGIGRRRRVSADPGGGVWGGLNPDRRIGKECGLDGHVPVF